MTEIEIEIETLNSRDTFRYKLGGARARSGVFSIVFSGTPFSCISSVLCFSCLHVEKTMKTMMGSFLVPLRLYVTLYVICYVTHSWYMYNSTTSFRLFALYCAIRYCIMI